jgi:D-alanyl-D-alanine carboxypeptidase
MTGQGIHAGARVRAMAMTTAVLVVGLLVAGPDAARSATPPHPGATCAAVLDPATKHFLYTKNPDRPCFTGSTAKAVTIDVAIRAYRQGKIALNSTFGFSQDAINQLCTCLGNYADDPALKAHADTVAVKGERIGIDKALYAADMSAVEPTVSLAEYVGNAVHNGVKKVGANVNQSEQLRLAFVALMNKRFSDLGLHDSHFANEHGGDAPLGNLPVPKSTAREMVEFWNAADGDPLFVPHLGLRDVPVTTTLPAGGNGHYTLTKWYGYYPNILGDKEGGVQPPGQPEFNSMLGSAKRLGRTLIFDVMENANNGDGDTKSEFTDSGNVLRYGFEQIFDPARRGDSGTAAGATTDNGLDCWASNRCVSAVRTGSDSLKVIPWGIHVGSQKLYRLGSADSPDTGVREVDVAHMGELSGRRIAVTAERDRDDHLVLESWRIFDPGQVTSLGRNTSDGGTGTQVTLRRLSSTRFVSAVKQDDGKLRLDSWKVAKSGHLTKLASATTEDTFDTFAMTVNQSQGVVTDLRLDDGTQKLVFWQVGASGAITRGGDSGDQGEALDHLSLDRVGPNEYMSAGTTAAGDAIVDVWEISSDGATVTKDGDMTGITGTHVTETALKRLGAHASLLAVRQAGNLRLYPLEYVTGYEHDKYGGHTDSLYRLGSASAGQASRIHLGAVSTTSATGDFVTALRTGSGNLKLINWRVGAKAH